MELNDIAPQSKSLAVGLDADGLYALAWADTAQVPAVLLSVRFDPTAPTPLKALEEAVYATDALTADYGRCEVLVRTDAYTAVPESFDDALCADTARAAALGGDEAVVTADDPVAGCRIVWGAPQDTLNFVRRTFRNPRIRHALTPLLEWFEGRAQMSEEPKVFINLHPGAGCEADMAFFGPGGALRGLISRSAPNVTDTMYFAIAGARRFLGGEAAAQYLVTGDSARRDALIALLKRYVPVAMPLLAPAAAVRADSGLLLAPVPLTLALSSE